jgi:hypothetical protein
MLFGALLLFSFISICHASTECTGKVTRIWTGDDNNNWLFLDTGVAAMIFASDADAKNILASATAALIAGKTVTIRFNADSVPCINVARNDVLGMYLNN